MIQSENVMKKIWCDVIPVCSIILGPFCWTWPETVMLKQIKRIPLIVYVNIFLKRNFLCWFGENIKIFFGFHSFSFLKFGYRLRHRGPDWSGIYQHGDNYLAHERLAIVDPDSGDQPLFNEDKTVVVTVRFNIYINLELSESVMESSLMKHSSRASKIFETFYIDINF